ncbi:jg3856 [Pararge aegeria aegeria]|uniref:Jg3856 protein n=1 Tax=Pararge aegeria aegeria TaxID=348720 RepID=A0A8S4S231_9NEOP|nr:jg3856 [Pararge aegeria aegeria]
MSLIFAIRQFWKWPCNASAPTEPPRGRSVGARPADTELRACWRRARRDVAAALALAALWLGRAPHPHRKHRGARR